MKLIKHINIVLLLLILSGCNDWLDVSPRQEMKESVIFSSEEGFKSVLNGAYLQMAESTLYGKNTSMYLPEILAQHWSRSADVSSTNYALSIFDYSHNGVENLIESVWKKYYSVIVHLNNLLNALEDSKIGFTYQNNLLMKGEAVGLRAFLHFELLRYFGPTPNNAVQDEKIIPYITKMTKDPNLLISSTWAEVIANIEKDLDNAERLLISIDPIVTGKETPDDDWHYLYRENRLNYYAVLGTKARFYQWIGNKEKAVQYAKMVIEAKNTENELVFTLSNESSYAESIGNLVMYSEILFGIQNPKLLDIVNPLFKAETASLSQTKTNINNAYESGIHPDDIRNKERRYWEEKTYDNSRTMNHFYKYTGNELGLKTSYVVPLLRLSELYFILIENLPINEAIPYFVNFRISRSMNLSLDESLTDEQAINAHLEKEYRKEFFGEGQMFFYYKRLNYTSYSWPTSFTLPQKAYILPLPKSQTVFE